MTKTSFRRVGVLLGGISSEREVSLKTGAGVLNALRERGYDAVSLDWSKGVSPARLIEDSKVDAVWIALHGTYGEDGSCQGLLECLGIPYTGSGVLASALAMDKVKSKAIFGLHKIPTPDWAIWSADGAKPWDAWGFPLVVKPSEEGSSVGVSLVRSAAEFMPAIDQAAMHRGRVLVERYIPGQEIHVAVLNDQVIGSVEVRTATAFYDYQAKYVRDDTQYLVPAPLPAAILDCAHGVALETHRAFGCKGYSRIDFRIDPEGNPYVLEVNTLPGMTAKSLVPKIAKAAGIDYADLVERILRSASASG